MSMSRLRAVTIGLRGRWSAFIAIGLAIVFVTSAVAQAPAAPAGAAPPPPAEELAKLVGPIALYPDDLVAIVLPAATSPLQLVQADRYLDKRKTDPKLPIDDKWDDPVKSLLNYPDVVKMMSADLDWTTALGEAVVADQGAVIEAVQAFRRKAKAAGNLKTDDKQVVKTEQEIVIIEPANPQVIYVPQYNPTTVVVQSAVPVYGYYPAPYPSYYYPYPPGAAMAAGVIWGAAIGAAWSGNHYGCCGDANINVNRTTNISTSGGARQQPAGGGTAWKSTKQPGQVSGSVGKTSASARAGDARAGASGAGAAGGAGARASAQPAGGASRGGGGGGDAFGGYGSGRETQMDSSRGASSRSASSGAGARPTSSGGGARSAPSGGGARGGGGGGGGRGGGGRR